MRVVRKHKVYGRDGEARDGWIREVVFARKAVFPFCREKEQAIMIDNGQFFSFIEMRLFGLVKS